MLVGLRWLVSSWMLLGLTAMSCSSYKEEIGGGFLIRTRVYYGMAHKYREHDLYYKGLLGIPRLIHKDISNAEVSPDGNKVLFFARRHRPEPLGMDYVLYVFDRRDKRNIKLADGEFYYTQDYWCPDSDKLVYLKDYGPIMLWDLSRQEFRKITDLGFYFLGWSPSGKNIAFATDKSVYDVNSLYYSKVTEPRPIRVAEKAGLWRREDFEWVTVDGEERIVVKESGE